MSLNLQLVETYSYEIGASPEVILGKALQGLDLESAPKTNGFQNSPFFGIL